MSGAMAVDESVKMCKEFVHKYYRICNSRPDLLYRLYSPNSRMSVSETVERNRCIKACASGQEEIRHLLTSVLDKIHAKLISFTVQNSARDQLLLMVNGLFGHQVSPPDHFFTQTFVLASVHSELAISSDVLQVYSHNLKRRLMSALQSNFENSKLQISITHPPVIDRKIRSKVGRTSEDLSPTVGSLFVVPTETPPSSTEIDAMKGENSDTKKTRCIEPDTAREAGSDGFRTRGWDAFSKDKPVEVLEDNVLENQTKAQDAYVDTPLINAAKEHQEKSEGLFLSCFGEVKKQQEIKAEVNYQWRAPSKTVHAGSYLRLFGFQPTPDGPPVEWDLSQDAVLTQLRTYHDVATNCFGLSVSKRRSRSMRTQVDWHQRTVYLDNLPVDVHPESLRKAFETTFGEIEEENGIIIASAKKSSIAYVVFKSLESAKAVGLADSWIKGSKIIIQKYRSPFPEIEPAQS